VYAFPNIIVVILGGIFIDRMGNKTSVIVLASLVAIGTLFVVLATYLVPVSKKMAFFFMLAGRFIFGYVAFYFTGLTPRLTSLFPNSSVGAESSYGAVINTLHYYGRHH